jgi:hypothetical protein
MNPMARLRSCKQKKVMHVFLLSISIFLILSLFFTILLFVTLLLPLSLFLLKSTGLKLTPSPLGGRVDKRGEKRG